MEKICFASETYSGVHKKILESVSKVNFGHERAYGDDPYTLEAKKIILEELGGEELVFVYNGTAANVMAIDSITDKYNSVICPDTAHIYTHEVGAPARFSSNTLFTVESKDGKLDVEKAEKFLSFMGNEHHSQPKVVSITQPTEYGTLYTKEEVKAIADFAHKNGMLLHMDGARIANAAVSQNSTLKEITKDLGVDVLSFGGTKNGLMFGEAVVYFTKDYSEKVKYLKKQNLQLNSKMRFLSAQFIPYIKENLWKINAEHANKMALMLKYGLERIEGIEISQEVEVNILYVKMSSDKINKLLEKFHFYPMGDDEIRLVTSFDTKIEEVEALIRKVKELSV
jgi:threonine aldolase